MLAIICPNLKGAKGEAELVAGLGSSKVSRGHSGSGRVKCQAEQDMESSECVAQNVMLEAFDAVISLNTFGNEQLFAKSVWGGLSVCC